MLCFHWFCFGVCLFVCLYYSVSGGLRSRFSYSSIEFHKYAFYMNIVLNIRHAMLVKSNHIAGWREMALSHMIMSVNIKVNEFILMEFFKFILFTYFQRQGKGRRKRERNISGLPLTHLQLGTWTATQPCALTGNQTCDLSVCRPMLNPLSHPSKGHFNGI